MCLTSNLDPFFLILLDLWDCEKTGQEESKLFDPQ